MKFTFLIPGLIILFSSSCNTGNHGDSDYVKSLEEKNKKLEQDLQSKNTKQNSDAHIYHKPSATNNNNTYFTIGSTEDDVIQIMGDPTSVRRFEYVHEKLFFYGSSIVTFKNGKVTEYSNNENNLRVKYKSNNEIQGDEFISTPTKKESSYTKYIYFSCMLQEFQELQSYYSQIYTVANFTDDKALKIKNCLVDQLKFFTQTEEKVFLIKKEFNTLSDASIFWNNETGKKIPGDAGCYIIPFDE